MNDFDEILENGLVFHKPPERQKDDGKVKVKAKEKQYIIDAYGSGSARQKARYRQQHTNRSKKRQLRDNGSWRELMGVSRDEWELADISRDTNYPSTRKLVSS